MSEQPVLIDILLVEDDASDILLTKKALDRAKIYNTLSIVNDGIDALAFLNRTKPYENAPRPDLILLDLNMPRMDGRELLQTLKASPEFKRIPVVVLTTSDAEQDVLKTYDLHANCYITKPVSLEQFTRVVNAIKEFWFAVVKLPPK